LLVKAVCRLKHDMPVLKLTIAERDGCEVAMAALSNAQLSDSFLIFEADKERWNWTALRIADGETQPLRGEARLQRWAITVETPPRD